MKMRIEGDVFIVLLSHGGSTMQLEHQEADLDSISSPCRDSAAGFSWEVGCFPLAASPAEEMRMIGSHAVLFSLKLCMATKCTQERALELRAQHDKSPSVSRR